MSTLKKAVTACVDSSSLIEAHKLLLDFCGDSLKELELVYHSRRSTDKRDAFEATLVDILSVFNKLDEADSIPPIFCEASQLIKIPSLEPDPVSKRLDTNYKAITGLVEKADNISLPLNNTKKALDQVVISLQDQLANLSSSVSSFSKSISDELRDPSSRPSHPLLLVLLILHPTDLFVAFLRIINQMFSLVSLSFPSLRQNLSLMRLFVISLVGRSLSKMLTALAVKSSLMMGYNPLMSLPVLDLC